jgi:lipoteichoic acid synthase
VSRRLKGWGISWVRGVHARLLPHASSVLVFAALFCTLAAKLFHAWRYGLLVEYPSWILADIGVLVCLDAGLAVACQRWPRKGVVRGALLIALAVWTWAMTNAGWLIRTGTQIVPMEVRPLFDDPVNTVWIVVVNLARMPGLTTLLLVFAAAGLTFSLAVLKRAAAPHSSARRLRLRVISSLAVGLVALGSSRGVAGLSSTSIAASGMRFNCHSRAVLSLLQPERAHIGWPESGNAARQLPRHDEIQVKRTLPRGNRNVVIVVLEGVQYDCTSLASEQGGIAPQKGARAAGLTPQLAALAAQGAFFTNARSVNTHTTKALFALLTGRLPCAAQDIAETVPTSSPYASLATILRDGLHYRTVFFQSAKGTFEARPGMVWNLGFEAFRAREDISDPNQFIGYLGADEFALLEPIADWIRAEDRPFLLVVLCSATHDPYEVPDWFGPRAKDRVERYLDTIAYTDSFLAALDEQLTRLHLSENTIFCVVGDHGEAFGEHGIMGHERLGFEEVLRIALCLRAPQLIEPGTRVTAPVGSLDLTPTILGLLGFDTDRFAFDGLDAFKPLPPERRVFFSGWMPESPTGFVQGDCKYVYFPDRDTVALYRLNTDPLELGGTELPRAQAQAIRDDIVAWRQTTIFRPPTERGANLTLYGSWLWKDNGRVTRIKYPGGG